VEFNLLRLYKFKNKEKYNNYNTNAKFVSRFMSDKDKNTYYPLFDEKGVSKAIKAFKAAKNKKEHIKHFAFLLNRFSPVNASEIMEQSTASTAQKEKLQKFIGVEKYEEYLKGKGFQYDQFKIDIEDLKYDNLWFDKKFQKYKRDFLTLLSNATDFLNDVLAEKRSLGQVEEKFKKRYINVVQQGAKLGRQPNSVLKAKVTALEYLRSKEAYDEVAKKITAVNEIFFAYTGMNLMQLSSVDTFKGEFSIYPRESYIFKDGDVIKLKNTLNKLKVEKIYATTALKREEFAVSWAGSSSALQNTAELDAEFLKANNIKDQIVRIKELIKGGKKAPKREEDPEPRVASRGSRGRTRRSVVRTTYRISKPKKDISFIRNTYQRKYLKPFYDKFVGASNIKASIDKQSNQKGKNYLDDGFYGSRTHGLSRYALLALMKALEDAKTKSNKRSSQKESKEKRIEVLSLLLNEKLANNSNDWLFEQEVSKIDYDKAIERVRQLVAKYNQASMNNWNEPAETDNAIIDRATLEEFGRIIPLLKFDDNGNISNIKEVATKLTAQPAVAAKGEPAKPAKEVVKRPSETSCFYAIDRTISGITDLSPTKIWASVGEDWVEWYKEALVLLKHEAAVAQPQFYYLSGEQSRYLGVVETMNKNIALNINLTCVSVYMMKFLRNLIGNMKAAQDFAQSGKGDADTYLHFVGPDKKTFKNSRADKLAEVLRRVIAKIPELRDSQNQNAQVTGDKGLATTQKQAALQNKAAVTAAKPSKAVAAAVATRGTPAPARNKPLDIDAIAKMFLERANKVATFKEAIIEAGTPDTANTKQVNNLAKEVFGTDKPTTEQEAMVGAAITKARNKLIGAPVPAASATKTPQQESLKQKREKLLHEAIFKKLVK
jgi:hypothetical protein